MKSDLDLGFWINVESSLLRQASIEGEIGANFAGDLLAGADVGATVKMTMTMTFSDFDVPVDIESPVQEAARTEFENVITATLAMMTDSGISLIPDPVYQNAPPCTIGTKNMAAFPDMDTVSTSKTDQDSRLALLPGDKDGYLLHSHDLTRNNGSTKALVNYMASATTAFCYTISADGSAPRDAA